MNIIQKALNAFASRKFKTTFIPSAFVAEDAATQLESIFYQSENGMFSIDTNSTVLRHVSNKNSGESELLEPQPAEDIKKAVIAYYLNNNQSLPQNFLFLKAYQPHSPTKPNP